MVFGSRTRRILFEATSFFLLFAILFSSSSIVAFSVPRNIGQDNIAPNLDPRHVDPIASSIPSHCTLHPWMDSARETLSRIFSPVPGRATLVG